MFVETANDGRVFGVEPGAGGQLHYPRPDGIGYYSPSQTGATIVVNPHHVSIHNVPRRGVARMQPEGFALSDLGTTADRPTIELAVQPGPG